MSTGFVVRRPAVSDALAMARVHVRSWQETYRGLMPDSVLDHPDAVAARERFWTTALTDPRYTANRTAMATQNESVIGMAMAGPPLDDDADWALHLYVLYVLAAHHGTGAGRALLDAVVPADTDTSLWVADPNPRAQAFYRKSGFVTDGTRRSEDAVPEIRMRRTGAA